MMPAAATASPWASRLLYVLSVVLLLIVADSFFNTSDGPMADANATSALGLILLLYIVAALAGSSQYDLGLGRGRDPDAAWPFCRSSWRLVFTIWAATRPSAQGEAP